MYFPGFRVPDTVLATPDLAEVLSEAEIILSVIPTPFVAGTLGMFKCCVETCAACGD